ncbi:hypothetical protein LCM19_02880 [Qipengyuania flava]|nr:hypothetical protein [Qipengyuania flava]
MQKFPDEPFDIVEQFADGQAVLTFAVDADALVLRHLDNKPQLKWAIEKKCADAAIIVQREDGIELHVVELKSKLTFREWRKARQQFEGMASNAFAVLGVIEASLPTRLICHLSYAEDALGPTKTGSTVLLKFPVGSSTNMGGLDDWKEGELSVFGRDKVPLRKWPRDPSTNSASATV